MSRFYEIVIIAGLYFVLQGIFFILKSVISFDKNNEVKIGKYYVDVMLDDSHIIEIQTRNFNKLREENDIKQKKELVKNLEEQIKILRKGRRGRDKTKTSDGKAKNFEIKSIEDKRRRSLEGLFGINPKLSGIQQDLKGKHIVIFDDNISSGATLDDICLELQKYGVASILPITLAIIPKTVYGQEHESLKNR